MRINRFLAAAGVASRRKCEEYVTAGSVCVNGGVVRDLSTDIANNDVVTLEGKIVTPAVEKIYVVMNKPRDVVCTCSDERGRKTVLDVLGNVLVPKVDFHNHGENSCTRAYLAAHGIELRGEPIHDIASMIKFSQDNVDKLKYDKESLIILLNGDFENCVNTGVVHVTPSIDYKCCIHVFGGDIAAFVGFLKGFVVRGLKIDWILGASRDRFEPAHADLLNRLIDTEFFRGIDLYGTENAKPNAVFVPFFKRANARGMITKVHAGEQLGADYVLECIRDFSPREIQHGISIARDPFAMKIARDKGIVFNVCPTSNVTLGYAKSIPAHPIRAMFDAGLRVTIGTDDLLFFQSDINDEYQKLLDAKVFTPQELNRIRKNALRDCGELSPLFRRLFPVGRLDYTSDGLLILTNDGDFTRAVTHPSNKVEKVYVATLEKKFDPRDALRLESGVEIDGEMTHPAKVRVIGHDPLRGDIVEITITQGRNRQVRRMFYAIGYNVHALTRVRIGRLDLGSLAPGQCRVSHLPPVI